MSPHPAVLDCKAHRGMRNDAAAIRLRTRLSSHASTKAVACALLPDATMRRHAAVNVTSLANDRQSRSILIPAGNDPVDGELVPA